VMHDPHLAERQAECATMLVAIARMLLNVDTQEFVVWIRLVADEIETKGLEQGLGIVLAANDDEASYHPP